MKTEAKLRLSLLLLRLGVFAVMLMWTLDKFVNPDHGIGVFKKFYFLNGMSSQIMYALGTLETVIILGFGWIQETLDLRNGAGAPRRIHVLGLWPIPGSMEKPPVLRGLAHARRLHRTVSAAR